MFLDLTEGIDTAPTMDLPPWTLFRFALGFDGLPQAEHNKPLGQRSPTFKVCRQIFEDGQEVLALCFSPLLLACDLVELPGPDSELWQVCDVNLDQRLAWIRPWLRPLFIEPKETPSTEAEGTEGKTTTTENDD